MKYLFAILAVLLLAAPASAGMSNMNALTLTPALASGSDYDSPVFRLNNGTDTDAYSAVFTVDNVGNVTLGNTGVVAVKEYFIDVAAADVYACTSAVISDSLNLWPTTATETQPDYPRNIVIMADSAVSCTGTVTVTGIDAQGVTRTSVYTFNATTDSQSLHYGPATGIDTDVYKNVTAFTRITSITSDSSFQSNATTADSIAVGWGNYLGLMQDVYGDTIYKSQMTSATNTFMYDVEPANHTFRGFGDIVSPGTAPDNTNDYIFYYRTNRITVKP